MGSKKIKTGFGKRESSHDNGSSSGLADVVVLTAGRLGRMSIDLSMPGALFILESHH